MAKLVLGIAFGPGFIQVAEVSHGPTSTVTRLASFALGEGDALDKPLELGKKFGAFLKENKFSAKKAVAGLPTQWLMVKMKTVPTMSTSNLGGMLRIQAERDFSLDPSDLILDYVAGEADNNGVRPLLLAAALRNRIENIRIVLKTAGLAVSGLTSSALALASASFGGTILSIGPFGAELIAQSHGKLHSPSVLASSIPKEGEWLTPVVNETRRGLAMRAGDPGAPIGFVNGVGLTAKQIEQLSFDLNVDVLPQGPFPGVDFAGLPDAIRYAHAIALSRYEKSYDFDSLDFFDSKLVEKTAGMFAKFKSWMVLVAILLVICLGWLAVSWYQDATEFDALNKQAEARKAETKAAKDFVTRFASTQGWYDKRPNVLDCLKELADVIPSDGGAWMTKLSVKEDFHCEMSAKAVNDKRYFEVLDRIEKNESFRDVKLVYMNKQDKKNTDVSFAISFIFWKQ